MKGLTTPQGREHCLYLCQQLSHQQSLLHLSSPLVCLLLIQELHHQPTREHLQPLRTYDYRCYHLMWKVSKEIDITCQAYYKTSPHWSSSRKYGFLTMIRILSTSTSLTTTSRSLPLTCSSIRKISCTSPVTYGMVLLCHMWASTSSKVATRDLLGIRMSISSSSLLLISFYAPTAGKDDEFLESISYLTEYIRSNISPGGPHRNWL